MNPQELTHARFLAGTARDLLAVALRQVNDIIRDNPTHYGTLQQLRERINGAREHVVEVCRILGKEVNT